MDALELAELKFNLECIGVEGDRLVRIGGDTCDDIEQACVLKTTDGRFHWLFGDAGLAGLPPHVGDIGKFFESDVLPPIMVNTQEVRRELWYWFKDPPTIPHMDVVCLGDIQETLDTFGVMIDGRWASRAWSVRRNAAGAEIAVETREEHRRKGYGSQVVSAWAQYQFTQGKIGIYAHRKYNLESQYLAKKTGAVLFAEILSLQ